MSVEKQYIRVEKQEAERFEDRPLFISTILKDIDEDKLVIPEFQRDFVWDTDKICLLFDSIYRGYTIGNLLLWKTSEKLAHKRVGDRDTLPIGITQDKREYTYVLDGQQRLTALYAVLRGKSVYRKNNKNPVPIKIYFDIEKEEFIKSTVKISGQTINRLENNGYLDSFRYIELSQVFNEQLNFPNNIIEPEREKIKEDLLKTNDVEEFSKREDKLGNQKLVLEKFKKIFKAYKISQIVDRDKNIDRIVTVFERINTQNVKLDIFDIMVAKTYEKIAFCDRELTFNLKKAIDKIKYINELKNEEYNPEYELADDDSLFYKIENKTLLRLTSIYIGNVNHDKISLQVKDIYSLQANEIQENLKNIRSVIQQIHRYAKNQLNIPTVNENYIDNKILSFLTYVFSSQKYESQNINLLNKWFWNTLLFNRYPGAQLQRIESDIKMYSKGETTFLENLKLDRNYNIFSKEYDLDGKWLINTIYNRQNVFYNALILLLNSLKPINFDGRDEINLSDYIGASTKNNKHHIIPSKSEAAGKIRSKYGKDKANYMLNNIANICIIGSALNKSILNENPESYFKRYEKIENFNEILKTHLIDEKMYEKLMDKKYEEFLILRTDKIVATIEQICSIKNEEIAIRQEVR